ncbi:2Fe-2S iron-sulfur cluster-binding protein [Thalassobacillus devorans]|uniref:2Fe-2S iron-sulfur cluster-binding protein n=1 Tax=Thalassobacillus devorans TaxID=279813 RepID=UPI0004910653|nr:2Fe-2S iron-sulfur cluster-binding protein [Thalassobacillus devorans]
MNQLVVKIDRSEMRTDQFEIDLRSGMTVLEAVDAIYFYHDPSLAYRYSCRTGLCTTCMMLINGKPGLSCMTIAEPGEDGILHLAPLPRGKNIKDLIQEV